MDVNYIHESIAHSRQQFSTPFQAKYSQHSKINPLEQLRQKERVRQKETLKERQETTIIDNMFCEIKRRHLNETKCM